MIDKDVWPSYSYDLNVMDFSVWGYLEKKACAKKHTNVEALKRSLVREWDKITPSMCATMVDGFMKRLDACIAAEGGRFDHLLK
uniref:Transposase n=1 Tax=Acrobeloides nanus TaxID=290746 RepID=A0A914BW50_9BILA